MSIPISGTSNIVILIGLFSIRMKIIKGTIPSVKLIKEFRTETNGKISMCVRIFVITPALAEYANPADVAP